MESTGRKPMRAICKAERAVSRCSEGLQRCFIQGELNLRESIHWITVIPFWSYGESAGARSESIRCESSILRLPPSQLVLFHHTSFYTVSAIGGISELSLWPASDDSSAFETIRPSLTLELSTAQLPLTTTYPA